MALPANYKWLEKEGAPSILVEALKHVGTLEHKEGNNPSIIKWAQEIGGKLADVYTADSIPWCGLFMAIVVKRARGAHEIVKDPLWALNWGTYGEKAECAKLGDILVFVRRTSTGAKAGHVGIYVGEDEDAYHVLGGNQKDAVNIARIAKDRLYTIRRIPYKVMPKNVRTINLPKTGKLSTNEQ
jgi:uncharacterized protein (TIGR02594 family)